MNRKERRAHNATARKLPKELTPVPKDEWPVAHSSVERVGVWSSRKYLVQVFEEANAMLRITVSRASVRSDGQWEDDLLWDELQGIKTEIGLGPAWAMEIYPALGRVVNVANMRHLWVLPHDVEPTFGWNING